MGPLTNRQGHGEIALTESLIRPIHCQTSLKLSSLQLPGEASAVQSVQSRLLPFLEHLYFFFLLFLQMKHVQEGLSF